MNFVYNKYDIFSNKPIELPIPIFTLKNYLILKYLNNYNQDNKQFNNDHNKYDLENNQSEENNNQSDDNVTNEKIERLLNIWLNMKYLNCKYNNLLEKQAIKYFGKIDKF